MLDPYGPNADVLVNTTYTMVYAHGAQNAAFRFPNF